eukprot:GFUD01070340.1.p1 GENE.GFUD01070340.1~~GFUD01070340.1.p1  ORF type:complete len:2430 (-),score=751.56 GFUD01070340.1:121-7410(-)
MGSKLVFFLLLLLIEGGVFEEDAAKPKQKKIGKIKAPTPKTPNTIIDDVPGETLVHIVDEHEHVAVLFYDQLDKKTKKVISEMEEMETEDLDVKIVRMKDDAIAAQYEVDTSKLPVLIFLQDGIPEAYEGDLKIGSEIFDWIKTEVNSNEIEVVSKDMLDKLIASGNSIAAIFSEYHNHGISGIKEIHSMCLNLDVPVLQIIGKDGPKKLGIDTVPALIYYEKEIPAVFEGDLDQTDSVLDWLMEHRTADSIEEVTEEILIQIIDNIEYVAVLFTGPCNEAARNTECEEILEELETIDDEVDRYGIALVTSEDIKYAGSVLEIRKFPALGMFRNGHFLLYEGDLHDCDSALSWILDEETLEIPGVIEEVGSVMLSKILDEERDVLVFFYEDEDTKALAGVMKSLEIVDDVLDSRDIEFVKISDDKIEVEYALDKLPSLVYFENEIPIEYDGNLNDPDEIKSWILEELENTVIRNVDEDTLEMIIDKSDDIVVIFYDGKKKKQAKFMSDMDTVDDEAEKMEIFMVKVDDSTIARSYGIYALPAVIHYENGVPNIYEGATSNVAILNWLEEQKTTAAIEEVNGVLLDRLIVDQEYVAVLFMSECVAEEKALCDELVESLEEIDEELDKVDILLVKMDEPQYAKTHKIKTFPTIGLFRNGGLVIYDGKLDNPMSLLKWLTDLENLRIEGRIEEVGIPLLEMIIEKEEDVFALLYEEGDKRAYKIINEMEGIDDNLENDKITLVKCNDHGVDDHFGIGYLPRLVYFDKGIPEMFPGAEVNEAEVLGWISAELKANKIHLVSRAIAEMLIVKREHVGLIFIDDEDADGLDIVDELEKDMYSIGEEELTIIQIDDPEFAEELGLSLPSLLHFTNEIPNVYKGNMGSGEEVLKWLVDKKEESVIEIVTRQMLEEIVEEEEYVAVLYTGSCEGEEELCEELLEYLEELDDEFDEKGIAFIQTDDEDFPLVKHQLTKLPALGLYRNRDFLLYEGDLSKKEDVTNWLNDVDNLKISGIIEKVNEKLLAFLYENEDNLVVFFYEEEDRDADEIIGGLESIDDELEGKDFAKVKICDEGVELNYGLIGMPKIVYFQHGIPIIFEDDIMDENAILSWIDTQSSTNSIHEVSDVVLGGLVKKFDHIAVLFYSHKNMKVANNLKSIADDCADNDIAIVKIDDKEEAGQYGLDQIPSLMFFNGQVPSVFTGDLMDTDDVFDWISKNQASSVVEEVTDEILEDLIKDHEYVAVFFRGKCDDEEDDCDAVLGKLESIDDDLDEIGILIVTTPDKEVSRENDLIELPALAMFRNGLMLSYGEDVQAATEKQLNDWLTAEDTLKIIGIIDEVNLKMLNNIIEEEDDCFVFFYEEVDPEAHAILAELEDIDEKLDKRDLHLVKISDDGAGEEYGIEELPALVYFENGVPEIFEGDLRNDNQVIKWMLDELKQEEIKHVTVPMLKRLIDRNHNLAVVFMDEKSKDAASLLELGASSIAVSMIPNARPIVASNEALLAELENIDGECKKYDIDFVQLEDNEEAAEYGVEILPAIIYFENRIPSLFDGDLTNEDLVLEWLVLQKTSDTIEQVTDKILEKLVEEEDYIAVFFSGRCGPGDICYEMLDNFENIDTKLSDYGVMFVSTEDKELGREFDIKFFPALGLFRNGDFVRFTGDLMDEFEVLEWIISRETLEIPGKIESVNAQMLRAVLEEESDLVVFMYREDNRMDEAALFTMDDLDKALDLKDVKMVSIDEKLIEKEYGLHGSPLLVHFNGNIPRVYEGDLGDETEFTKFIEESLEKSDIEEVNGDILDSLVTRLPNIVAVFFDSDNEKNMEIMALLEGIDDDCDKNGIPFVKIDDVPKANDEFGLDSLPAVLYWKGEVPSVYAGDVSDTAALLDWIVSSKTGDNIELVTEEILEDMVDKFEYVVAYFQAYCKDGDVACQSTRTNILTGLEDIDDNVDDIGISMVTTKDVKFARKLGIPKLPCIGLFRNGDFQTFSGDLNSEVAILNWLSDIETLEIAGVIEEVNSDMLGNIIRLEDDVLVFFYDPEDKDSEDIILELETIDDNLDEEEVEFVKCSEPNAQREYGLTQVPALVFFENGVPEVYPGDLKNDDETLAWITLELSKQEIEEVNPAILGYLMDSSDFLAVFYYQKDARRDASVLARLENIDDDCKLNDINFVKVGDEKEVAKLGMDDSPVLVYYENGIPNLYEGSLGDEATVLDWLVIQRNSASIEDVTDELLRSIIENEEFVAVYFSGLCADDDQDECDLVREELEKIDHILDDHGIVFVATHELEVAKENKIKRFPALGLFKNEEFIKYDGDLTQEIAVLKWLTSEETLDIPEKIEEVNEIMLSKRIKSEENIFVFFYEDDDIFAQRLLKFMETFDNSLDKKDIDFVKISDEGIDKDYSLECLPALVHFNSGTPTVFPGDLREEKDVKKWIDKRSKVKSSD